MDALRRKHNYDEFIVTYLKILAENGKLAEIIQNTLDQAIGSGSLADVKQQAVTGSSTNTFNVSHNTLFLPQVLASKRRKKN
jgi:hypothetical protein